MGARSENYLMQVSTHQENQRLEKDTWRRSLVIRDALETKVPKNSSRNLGRSRNWSLGKRVNEDAFFLQGTANKSRDGLIFCESPSEILDP